MPYTLYYMGLRAMKHNTLKYEKYFYGSLSVWIYTGLCPREHNTMKYMKYSFTEVCPCVAYTGSPPPLPSHKDRTMEPLLTEISVVNLVTNHLIVP